MNQQRLKDLQANLDLLYAKLGVFEKDLIISDSPSKTFELKERIKLEILPKIRSYESEYWALAPQETIVFSEQDAESTLVEVSQAITHLSNMSQVNFPTTMVKMLAEIQNTLERLDQSATAKLKVTLPIIPMLASYELEMDTEGVLIKIWQSIRKRLRR